MSLKRRLAPAVITILLAAALVTATTPPAVADPSWTRPDTLSRYGYYGAIVRSNGGGHILALKGGYASTREPSGSWDIPGEPIPSGYPVDAVVDARGNVTVLSAIEWECDENTERYWYHDVRMQVAYRPDGGSWRRQTLPGTWNGCSFGEPRVAVDPLGSTTAVWRGDGQLWVTQRPRGDRWSPPAALGAALAYDVVADGAGRAVAVWVAPDTSIVSAVRQSGGTWSRPRVVVEPAEGETVDRERLVLEGGGEEPVLATWTERLGRDATLLRTAFRATDGRWQDAQTIASTTAHRRVRYFDSAVSQDEATVVWFQGAGGGGPGSVRAASGTTARWSDPVLLQGSIPRETVPSVAANDLGLVAAWTAGDEATAYTMTARRQTGGRWGQRRQTGPSSPVERTSTGYQRWAWFNGAPEAVAYRENMFTVLYNRPGAMFSDFVDDTTPPHVRLRTARHHLDLPSLPVRWNGLDDLTGVRHFDVRVRTAGVGGRLSAWSRWQTRTGTTDAEHRVKPGRTYCFSARARDRAGNLGRWSSMRCAATPVDDRALRATAGWKRAGRQSAYRGTLTRTSRVGQTLRLPGVNARRVSLVVRTCPRCGAVQVWHGQRDLGRVDLGRALGNKRVIRLRPHTKRLDGRVVIRVVSRGKPVQIDGVIAQR